MSEPITPKETPARTMNGATMILQALRDQGVEVVFGYPGGAILPFYDALSQSNDIRHILVRHEQAAVHAAQGYSRVTGKVGVVIVTSGPGITNAVTGLTDALMDSTPIICISGQVPTHLIGTDAFQECDATGITRPSTKYNILLPRVESLCWHIHRAFGLARSGRPGPVHIDVPKDVQMAVGTYQSPAEVIDNRKAYPQSKAVHNDDGVDPHDVMRIAEILCHAQRPVIYGGGGLCIAGQETCDQLTHIVKTYNLPTTLTLMGLGAVPADAPQFLGMLGMHGTYEANMSMHQADVILALGARFDDRVTGNVTKFSPHAQRLQIDIDPSSINKNIHVHHSIVGDLHTTIPVLVKAMEVAYKKSMSSKTPRQMTGKMLEKTHDEGNSLDLWWKQINDWRKRKSLHYQQGDSVIKPQHAIARLATVCGLDDHKDHPVYITTEVGQHQMWAAQHFPYMHCHQWVTSGGLGTMGFGLPAAIGMQIAHPKARIVNIAGEASILMCIQELSTAVQYKLPVVVMIINNRYMGMVRQWQDLLHGGRHSQSYSEALPDFVALAEAFGALGIAVTKPGELDSAIDTALKDPRPVLIDIAVDPMENCLPMIPSGAAHNEMILHDSDPSTKVDVSGTVLV